MVQNFERARGGRRTQRTVIAFVALLAILATAVVWRLRSDSDASTTRTVIDATSELKIPVIAGASLVVKRGDVASAGKVEIVDSVSVADREGMPEWFQPAAPPVEVRVEAQLSKPVSLHFSGRAPDRANAIPVILRRSSSVGWYAIGVGAPGGKAIAARKAFSPISFGWVYDVAERVSSGARSLLGDRSPKLSCSAPPAWVDFNPPSQDVVHSCAQANTDASSGEVRAEVKLRNNRGVVVEVKIPGAVSYAHVEGQADYLRETVRIFTGGDNVLLPPGVTMSIGFRRPSAAGVTVIPVSITPQALVFTMLDEALGGDKSSIYGVYASLRACTPGVLPGVLGDRLSIDSIVAGASSFAACAKDLLSDEQSVATLAKEQLPNGSADQVEKLRGTLRLAGRALGVLTISSKAIDVVADLYTHEVVGGFNSMSPSIGFRADPRTARGITEAELRKWPIPADTCDPSQTASIEITAAGDLDGDGLADGAVAVLCYHVQTVLTVLAKDRQMSSNAVKLTKNDDLTESGIDSLTDIDGMQISNGQLIVRMQWAYGDDAFCCPTTRAIGTYRRSANGFTRSSISITSDATRMQRLVGALNSRDKATVVSLIHPGQTEGLEAAMDAGARFTLDGCDARVVAAGERVCHMTSTEEYGYYEVVWTGDVDSRRGSPQVITGD